MLSPLLEFPASIGRGDGEADSGEEGDGGAEGDGGVESGGAGRGEV